MMFFVWMVLAVIARIGAESVRTKLGCIDFDSRCDFRSAGLIHEGGV